MQVKVLQQLVSDLLRGFTIRKDAVRHDYANPAARFYDRHDVLQEIDLIIRGFNEFRAVCGYVHAALRTGAEGRIC